MWPFRKPAKQSSDDARWAARDQRLVDMWPDINDPTSERFYYARLTGNQLKEIIEAERALTKPGA